MALGTYEKPEMNYLLTRLRPGDCFLDVGAHAGYFSLPAARVVGPTGRIIAIEATPASARLLRANVELNGFPWLTVVEVAASNRDGQALLSVSPYSPMWNSVAAGADTVNTISVRARTIDSILAESGWPPIAGMKVDVEGAELDVLRGSLRCLERNPQAFLIVEMSGHPDRLEPSLAALRLLEGLGYTFRRFQWGRAPKRETVGSIARALTDDYLHDYLFNILAEKPAP